MNSINSDFRPSVSLLQTGGHMKSPISWLEKLPKGSLLGRIISNTGRPWCAGSGSIHQEDGGFKVPTLAVLARNSCSLVINSCINHQLSKKSTTLRTCPPGPPIQVDKVDQLLIGKDKITKKMPGCFVAKSMPIFGGPRMMEDARRQGVGASKLWW